VDDAVNALAKEAGIAVDWIDASDQPQRVSIGSLRRVLDGLGYPNGSMSDVAESRERLRDITSRERTFFTATVGEPTAIGGTQLPAVYQPGYYRLNHNGREITVAVAPERCVTFADLAPGARLYGLAVQLYSLRRHGDDGFGDTRALNDLVAAATREGADAVALSPTHSVFAADPARYAPYSPSSRLFLNPLHADPAAVFGAERVAAARAHAEPHVPPIRDALIDWSNAASAKYALLRRLYDDFAAKELSRPGNALASDFMSFDRDGGERLRDYALFEALHRHQYGQYSQWSWVDWPPDSRNRKATGARQFADQHTDEVRFHIFMQWLADRAFRNVQKTARERGMRIGLISDLAVGINPSGGDAWSRPKDLLLGLNMGAPPDLFNARGQDWGLTAFSPQALLESGFEPFITTLRAAMRSAGGVRIDHVMGLSRLWLVPQGASPAEGAYLFYPLDDLVRLIAIESHRHGAVVIGEDLGTVQPKFRRRIADTGIGGMDVLWFQREGDAFLPPSEWRHDAVAMTSTHDLPTVAGWWTGTDIATRAALGLAEENIETKQRAKDRTALWHTFQAAGVAEAGAPLPKDATPAVDAAIRFTAQSPATMALIPIEDVLGLTDQPNIPGTVDEHPNWRRRLDAPAAGVLDPPQVRARLKTLRER
jgi:4-alpha-glucanotransferase